MKTDIIKIKSGGEGIEAALCETEKAAVYRGLEPKQALRLRLLAEEMTGMLRTIVGDENEYSYWVENEGKSFMLHLTTAVKVDRAVHEELLKTSSSGKNAAAKGFMGMVREILIKMRETGSVLLPSDYGYTHMDVYGFGPAPMYSADIAIEGWSLNAYRRSIEPHKHEEPEKWDELEKSITANLADDVKIFIRGKSVELVVEKDFE